MQQYLDTLKNILDNGISRGDRTGTGRRSIFGVQQRYNLIQGFPLLTTRKINIDAVIKELLWIISGSTSNNDLNAVNVGIWNQWAVTEIDIDLFINKYFEHQPDDHKAIIKTGLMENTLGSLGPIYGEAWRNAPCSAYNMLRPFDPSRDLAKDKLLAYTNEWAVTMPKDSEGVSIGLEQFLRVRSYQNVDQLHQLITGLKEDPYSARHVISAWIPEFIPYASISPQENVLLGKGALAPCHVLQQYFVTPSSTPGGKPQLSMLLYQRSCDYPVGSAFNIPSYSLLLMMVAQVCDMVPGEFIYSMGDTHAYLDQLPLVEDHISRLPTPLPVMRINPSVKDILDFKFEDFTIVGYDPQVSIKYPVSV